MLRRIALGVLDGALLVWILMAPLGWVVRDGLGANAVDSPGWHAVTRFCFTFYWGPVFAFFIALRL